MSRRMLVALVLLAGCAETSAVRQEPNSRTGMMHGPGHAYLIEAPEGWVLDTQVGRSMGLYAVFGKLRIWGNVQPVDDSVREKISPNSKRGTGLIVFTSPADH